MKKELEKKLRQQLAFKDPTEIYAYTIAHLKAPRFYRRSVKRMQTALGTMNREMDIQILDVGCGAAYFTFLLSKFHSGGVIGIDFSKALIKMAKVSLAHKEGRNKIQFVVTDGEHLPFRENSFNLVLCSDFLHHVPSVPPVIEEMTRVAMIGGKIVAIEPNFLNPCYPIFCLIQSIEPFEGYLRSSRWGLRKVFKENNLGNIAVREIDFYPQLFLELKPFPEKLSKLLDYLEELLRRNPASFVLSSHFSIMGVKKKEMSNLKLSQTK